MENFISLCRSRRSIRKYTDQPVPKEAVETILKCGLMSPSSKRLNPWEFVVLTDKEKIRSLASCKTYGSQMLLEAPLAIVVAVDKDATDTWQCDGAIAAQNMLLAAEDLGLGACWCQVYQREDSEEIVRKATNIPEKYAVLCIVAVGYKNEERKQYDESKLLYDKIHYEQW